MASPNGIAPLKIHEVTKITPSSTSTWTSSTAASSSLPLTFFDTLWFKFPPVERLFFYQLTESPYHFNAIVLPKLKQSLSLSLRHYLPLAGNLIWLPGTPKPAIYYSPNDGVSLTIAESSLDFNSLVGNGVHEAIKFHPLVPELFTSDDKAEVISIRITYFRGQGFCVGISTHHALLDGKSSTMFMKSWAYLCKELKNKENPDSLPKELTPFFERSIIKDPTGIDMIYVNNWLDFTGSSSGQNKRSLKILPNMGSNASGLIRATFELKREDIKKLRDKVSQMRTGESKSLHLSTFVLTLAYASVCIIKAKGVDSEKDITLGFMADCRSRLDPPIPSSYIGNCVWLHPMFAKAGDVTVENGVAFVAEKLSDVIKGVENIKDALDGAEEKLANTMKTFGKYQPIGVAGSPRFEDYRLDFGWGRPEKVEIVSIDRTGAISLTESKDGNGGVELGVVLQRKEMEVFASLFVDGLKN